jgi:hypothetical protein
MQPAPSSASATRPIARVAKTCRCPASCAKPPSARCSTPSFVGADIDAVVIGTARDMVEVVMTRKAPRKPY